MYVKRCLSLLKLRSSIFFFFQILIRDVYYTETDKVELLQLQVPEAQVVGFEVAPFEKVKRLNKTQLDKKLSKKLTFHEVLECSTGFTRRSSIKKAGFN